MPEAVQAHLQDSKPSLGKDNHVQVSQGRASSEKTCVEVDQRHQEVMQKTSQM